LGAQIIISSVSSLLAALSLQGRMVQMPKEKRSDIIEALLKIPAEDHETEFKRIDKDVSGIIESIVGMANADGGIMILGIEDPEKNTLKGDKRIFGVEENISNFDNLGREIQKVSPPLSSVWPPDKFAVGNGLHVALVAVPKVTDGLRSFNNHVYLRQEKSNKRLTPAEVVKFSYVKGFERADRELVEVDFRLLDTPLFKEWRKQRKISGTGVANILEKVGLAKFNDKKILLPTRAAVLLFAEYPSNLMDTKACIRIMQYTGTTFGTKSLISTPRTVEGAIIPLIKEAHEYVLTLLRSGVRVPSGFVTKYRIPERAVKEAITNAVIHRDYHLKRDIEIRIFEDRIEINSPGLFPFNITPANVGIVRSEGWRNDLLVKHLREFPSPPNLDQNEGVPTMRSEMKSNNLYPPIFLTYPTMDDSVRVILLNAQIASEWEKVSACLEEKKYITNEEARAATGIIQRDKMSRILKNWVKQGLLVQIVPKGGYLRATKYKLPTTKATK
jgi:ATP-dependent DNA helicase RecG